MPIRPPIPITSFIGRQVELVQLTGILRERRLVTLSGPGGVGKTRLAIEVSRELGDARADGILFVDLSPITDATLVPTALLVAVGRHGAGLDPPTVDTVVQQMRSRDMLLVLDNCEHLIDVTAALVQALLGAAPNVSVLATSREPLGVTGEQLFRVSPLQAPHSERLNLAEQASRQPDAVELFVDRARLVEPTFEVDAHTLQLVAHICYQLDGLPLAIELAAARVRALSLEQLATRIDQQFDLVASSARGVPPRQRTLAATLDWSYQLLRPAEQAAFECLAIFAGSWTLEAAEAVCANDARLDEPVVDLLTSLVDKSLVVHEAVNGQGRYRFLETIHRYALDRLEQSAGVEAARSAHSAFYLDWLASDPRMARFQPRSWVRSIDLDYDNIRLAVRWSLQHGDLRTLVAAGTALTRYGAFRGYLRELRDWWEAVLEPEHNADGPLASGAGVLLAMVLFLQGNDAGAKSLLTRALGVFRHQRDTRGTAHALLQLGWLSPLDTEARNAEARFREALALFERLQQHEDVAWSLFGLGNVAQLKGEHRQAEGYYQQALRVISAIRTPETVAQAIALEGLRPILLAAIGSVALARGQVDAAAASLRSGVLAAAQLGSADLLATGVLMLATVALARSQPARAARLIGAAEGLWSAIESGMLPIYRPTYTRLRAEMTDRLGEYACNSLRAEGERMSLSQIAAFALSREVDDSYQDPLRVLTRREREVALLVARGLSNREIASVLVITEGTARVHVERVLAKLDLHSRAQLAAWAAERGLRQHAD
jgi:non-specific serine/threonine protein kinase